MTIVRTTHRIDPFRTSFDTSADEVHVTNRPELILRPELRYPIRKGQIWGLGRCQCSRLCTARALIALCAGTGGGAGIPSLSPDMMCAVLTPPPLHRASGACKACGEPRAARCTMGVRHPAMHLNGQFRPIVWREEEVGALLMLEMPTHDNQTRMRTRMVHSTWHCVQVPLCPPGPLPRCPLHPLDSSRPPPADPLCVRQWRWQRGNVCLACAQCATFLLTILTSAPDLPSHGEAPQVDHVGLHTFPTKHVA